MVLREVRLIATSPKKKLREGAEAVVGVVDLVTLKQLEGVAAAVA